MGDELLRKALGYKKFEGENRVLVLDTSYLVVRDVVDGSKDLGWHTATVPMENKGSGKSESLASLLKAIVAHRPDFVLTVNHLGFDEGGALSRLLSSYSIPMASWFVDHPLPILGGKDGNATDYLQVFCFERTALKWLAQRGYSEPIYLPTASNRRYYHPEKIDCELQKKLTKRLSFAGNSWWTKARVEPPKWARQAAERLGKKKKIDRHALTNGFDSLLASSRIATGPDLYKIAQVALAEASMSTRRSFARALMPLGITIFGDPYWSKMAPGIDLVPFVDYERSLPALFAGSSVNANVTAEQMPTAVNQRVWDVPAVGGFLLTDAQDDALELFKENEEIVVYRSFEEAADKARYYLGQDELRLRIAGKAFEKVERLHRMTHRLAEIAAIMRKKFG